MNELIVDGKLMQSREAMYVHLTRVFSLPGYFGNNLDALWDILTEKDEPIKIEIINADFISKYLGEYGESLLKLFEKLAFEHENYEICFKK